MSALSFKISSELESAGFKGAADWLRSISDESKKAKTSTKEQSDSVDLLKKAYGALVSYGIVQFYRAAYEASALAKEQEIQLSSRVDQTGLSYERAKPKLDAFFQALQDQSGVARDKLVPAFNFLLDKTNNVRASQELMTTVMGLARTRGLQLADAADLVSGAYIGQQRSLMLLAKDMGLTTEQAKNHNFVIEMAKSKYAQFAVSTDASTIALDRLKNTMSDVKQKIGDGLSSPIQFVSKQLSDFLIKFESGFEQLGISAARWVEIIRINFELVPAIFKKGFSKAKEEAQIQLNEVGKIADEQLRQLQAKMNDALNPKTTQSNLNNLVDATHNAFQAMNNDELKLIAEGNAAMADGDRHRLETRMKLLDAEKALLLENLHQQQDFLRLSGQDQLMLEVAITQRISGEKKKLWQAELAARYDILFKGGEQLGIATAKALAGEKDAWKNFTISVIDMIAQKAEAHVMAAAIERAAEALLIEDYYGAAKAIGIGVVETAAIAGVAQGAKSLVGGSGGGGGGGAMDAASSVGASMGLVTAASSPASLTPNSKAGSLTIYVQGDVVDSDTFMNSLAAKLSSKVENQDIRLIASGVKG